MKDSGAYLSAYTKRRPKEWPSHSLDHLPLLLSIYTVCARPSKLPRSGNATLQPPAHGKQRSKSKRHYRAVKRSDSASAYKIAEDIRLQRLSAQLKQSALKPRALTDKEEWERKQAGFETDDDEEEGEGGEQEQQTGMETEEPVASTSTAAAADGETKPEDDKKISTSGPRMSRREAYRSSKGFTVKQTPTTHFRSKGEKKRMGCKPHRRR
ncbi:hypothetical protein BMF94_2377 [Rhodotorula taiwanensis]|uniref:DUF2423 domain-containing protein n=1 Tax=Rhodotorula taiwanensis TaxID=741276 RepID=A0A2S5BCW0_9BASI|nr:hypothetical protein BMF94_2377 [Rhodotorula taiwanensis]